jgi:hypothetical protein
MYCKHQFFWLPHSTLWVWGGAQLQRRFFLSCFHAEKRLPFENLLVSSQSSLHLCIWKYTVITFWRDSFCFVNDQKLKQIVTDIFVLNSEVTFNSEYRYCMYGRQHQVKHYTFYGSFSKAFLVRQSFSYQICHGLSGWNNRNLFFHSSGDQMSMINILAHLISIEGSVSCRWYHLEIPSLGLSLVAVHRERE